MPGAGTISPPVDLSHAPAVLADLQAGVLLRSLLIAVVLLTPYGLYKRRQVQRQRAAAAEPPTEGDAVDAAFAPRLEDLVASLPDAAATARELGSVEVLVPPDVTVDGAAAPAELVDALVRDGLRRSGLVAVAEADGPDGRTIECRPAPPA